MWLLRINLHNLCPNMNHFDAVDFIECDSEEVISFFWSSVYVGVIDLALVHKTVSPKLLGRYIHVLLPPCQKSMPRFWMTRLKLRCSKLLHTIFIKQYESGIYLYSDAFWSILCVQTPWKEVHKYLKEEKKQLTISETQVIVVVVVVVVSL